MKKLLLAGVALAAVSIGASANAADLGAARAPIADAVMAPASTWTGFYAGLHLGHGWGTERSPPFTLFQDPPTARGSGVIGGGQFGWNHQFRNNVVFGLEATLALAQIKATGRETADYGDGLATVTASTTMNWLATMGPRLGYAIDRTLVYGKGGFAAAGFRHAYAYSGNGSNWAGTGARGGWFLGAGVEHMIAPNWAVKLEYNYLDFTSGAFILTNGTNQALPTKIAAHTVTLGVNYLFAAGPSAASAGCCAPHAAGAMAIMTPASTWTGFYAGLHLGYGWGTERFAPLTLALDALTGRGSGVAGGGQFGWNHQFQNNVIFGLEATLALADIKGTQQGVFATTTMNWLATMGPRLGYAIDRTLVYGKAGFAAAGFRHKLNDFGFNSSGLSARGGWFLGAGVEHKITPNWTVKLEYNYLDFTSGAFALTNGTSFATPTKITAHTVTLGVNYLFSTGPAAVSARY